MADSSMKLVQAKIRAAKALDADMEKRIKALFALLDPFELDMTYEAFEGAFLAEMSSVAGRHYALERAFLDAYIPSAFGIAAKGTDLPYTALSAEDQRALRSSLTALTKASIKAHSANGDNIMKAYTDAQTRVVGLGKRAVRAPSRRLVARVGSRTKGLGYYKRVVTSSKACSWCNMIQSRGAVYTIDTAQGAWHDNCSCIAVPARMQDGPKPTTNQKLMVKPKKTELDKEKIRQNIAEYERKVASGEIVPTPLPPRPTYV